MPTTLYGIKNCDTVRKARRWLDSHGVDYAFHDLRSDGLDPATLAHWAKAVGWERLLNRRGRTWRELPEDEREGLDEAAALKLMAKRPTLIKRPVVEHAGGISVGFSEKEFAQLFAV